MPSPPVFLIITHAADHWVPERVAAGVARRGGRAVRIDSDRFPATLTLSQQIDGRGESRAALGPSDGALELDEVEGVWVRHLVQPDPPDDTDPRDHAQTVVESAVTFAAVLEGLRDRGVRLIDPPAAQRAVGHDKPRQLREAARAGLLVPETLVTNDPEAARRFVQRLAERGEATICKLQTTVHFGMEGRRHAPHTQRVTPADLEALDALALCPMMFQSLVPKRRELRIAWVDGRPFCGAVRTDAVDCRHPLAVVSPWEPATLPPDVEQALARLMNRLGLSFGAVDVVERPDGGHVFLEVNPTGEWGMLERDLDLPIADAIAAALCGTGAS